jgi:hypothetical protein
MRFPPVPLSPSASPSCSSFLIVQPWSLTEVPGAPLPPSPYRSRPYRRGEVSCTILPSAHLDDLKPIAIDPHRHIHQSLGSPALAPRIRRVSISGTRSNHFTVPLTLSPTPFRGSRPETPPPPPGPRAPFFPSGELGFAHALRASRTTSPSDPSPHGSSFQAALGLFDCTHSHPGTPFSLPAILCTPLSFPSSKSFLPAVFLALPL